LLFSSGNNDIDTMRPAAIYRLHGNATLNRRFITSLVRLLFPLLVLLGCGKPEVQKPLLIFTARLAEGNGLLNLVLHNESACEATICRRNFYDMVECLDVRRFPDTAEFSPEQVFGKKSPGIKRSIITLDDYLKIGTGQEITLPLDLRCIAAPCKLGDSVFVSVFFKNIDPTLCSKVEVGSYDKATQDYCRLLHVIPTLANNYWSGEIRTSYYVHLCTYAPPKSSTKRRSSKVTVIRRSTSHPLDHKVF
jgi:hypothetical protein